MATYILRPKSNFLNRVSLMVSMPSVQLSKDKRTEQLKTILELTRKDPVHKEIRQWLIKQLKSSSGLRAADAATPVTGTIIVDLSESELEAAKRDLPEVAIIPDRTLDLIQPNRRVATAARKSVSHHDLWHLKTIGVMTAKGKRKNKKLTGKGVCIAVLDTGIDATHPQLTANKVKGAYHFSATGQAVSQPTSIDTDGHGTHVAGLIAGDKTGVAPQAELISAVMIPGGQGRLKDFIFALDWAASVPEIQIVCMSAGLPGFVPELHDAIANLVAVGILPVVAVGNEGLNRTRSPGNYAEVLSVGACDKDEFAANFSSSGGMVVDHHMYGVPYLLAPGEGVVSSILGGGYAAWDGTSMATPVVAGVAALLLQEDPDMAIIKLMDELFNRAYYNDDELDYRQGYGVVHI
jgi:subtilisin family serine protease